MTKFVSIEYTPKVKVTDSETLALVYTPGVAYASNSVKNNLSLSYELTNRENTVGVFAYDYEKALNRAIFLKDILNIDAYPFEISEISVEKIKFILKNLEPSFAGFDITLLNDECKNFTYDLGLPILKGPVQNLKEFFLCVSKGAMIEDFNSLADDFKERSLELRRKKGGVIETTLSIQKRPKPVGIISDGSAVLGLGNIGAEAGMPVMEGKAVLFKSLGDVDAMPLCVKTQNSEEIVELVLLLEKSFSGINFEDISAPRCFEIEEKLIEKSSIPIFHDDQHGTAIIVLAALTNALYVVKKSLKKVKIVFSGAGAAAVAVAKLLLKAGAENIIMTDKDGVVYKGRKENSQVLEKLCEKTNLKNVKGKLKDVITEADVFIGLSAPNVLTPEMISKMAVDPIIFALANPTPEIMPEVALKAGAKIVSTGRSDFPNQVNNSLVFPGLFRAVLDYNIKKITDDIKIKSAIAIAGLISDDELSTTNIVINALSPLAVKAIVTANQKN